jgi:hypothetical protein
MLQFRNPYLVLLCLWSKDAIKAEAVSLSAVIDWPAAVGQA